jgi:hypothetical protein
MTKFRSLCWLSFFNTSEAVAQSTGLSRWMTESVWSEGLCAEGILQAKTWREKASASGEPRLWHLSGFPQFSIINYLFLGTPTYTTFFDSPAVVVISWQKTVKVSSMKLVPAWWPWHIRSPSKSGSGWQRRCYELDGLGWRPLVDQLGASPGIEQRYSPSFCLGLLIRAWTFSDLEEWKRNISPSDRPGEPLLSTFSTQSVTARMKEVSRRSTSFRSSGPKCDGSQQQKYVKVVIFFLTWDYFSSCAVVQVWGTPKFSSFWSFSQKSHVFFPIPHTFQGHRFVGLPASLHFPCFNHNPRAV